MSHDGKTSIVVIALLGNPFSPHYARARARGGDVRALDHCALNVAVYSRGSKRWALHERRVEEGDRQSGALTIGRSRVRWEGDALVVEIDEETSPWARPLRGTVTFHAESATGVRVPLDAEGLHAWWPVAPHGRIDVALEQPSLRFAGHGYHDANAGEVPLETSFARWTWSRARLARGHSRITYRVASRRGDVPPRALDLDVRRDAVHDAEPLLMARLPVTGWRLEREAGTERGYDPQVVRELEDSPFYARALIETRLDGRRTLAVHETLSLDRFSRYWVQFLLPFRMRRG